MVHHHDRSALLLEKEVRKMEEVVILPREDRAPSSERIRRQRPVAGAQGRSRLVRAVEARPADATVAPVETTLERALEPGPTHFAWADIGVATPTAAADVALERALRRAETDQHLAELRRQVDVALQGYAPDPFNFGRW